MAKYLNKIFPFCTYNPYTIQTINLDLECEHDFRKEDAQRFDTYGKINCSKCKGYITIQVHS